MNQILEILFQKYQSINQYFCQIKKLYIKNIKIDLNLLQNDNIMKIILRDILRTYFPKYSSLYQNLSQQEKDHIFSQNNLHNKSQDKQSLVVPELLSKKSWMIKDKGLSNGQRSKSRDDTSKIKIIEKQQVGKNQVQVDNFTLQEQQRLGQIMNERLRAQIKSFIHEHRFCTPSINTQQCLSTLSKILLQIMPQQTFSHSSKSRSAPKPTSPSHLQQNLYKLSLYLNKETNKQIFSVYEYILTAGPKTGISYEILAKRLKTDIINVSHYCCKLKKMRFIDWEHKKQGIVVFPKVSEYTKTSKSQHKDAQLATVNLKTHQNTFDYSKSFLFNELTLNENILINVASSASLLQGGLTNEQIKFKIMKHAQNKMVRRTVEGMKHIQRNAQRQGKVFQFKYKKQTPRMIKQMDRKRVQNSGIIQLTQICRQYLNKNFSAMSSQQLTDQQLLQHIVNTKLTDYVSSIGIKQSKRQCTPLKLNRYIYILNYLEVEGPESSLDLRRHIIEVEKDLEIYQGIIHKRSVIGILEGLKKIQLIEEIHGYFYPKWIDVQRKPKIDLQDEQNYSDNAQFDIRGGNKKLKLDKSSKDNKKPKNHNKFTIPHDRIRMITKRQHLSQIFTQLLNFTFQKALKRVLRKGFHRIMYAHRKKQSVPMFVPQPNILHLLDQDFRETRDLSEHATTLESFMSQINNFVSTEGKKLQGFPQIQYEVVRFLRRNPNKNADNLRSKYGKSWKEKFDILEKEGVIKVSDEGYETVANFEGFLV